MSTGKQKGTRQANGAWSRDSLHPRHAKYSARKLRFRQLMERLYQIYIYEQILRAVEKKWNAEYRHLHSLVNLSCSTSLVLMLLRHPTIHKIRNQSSF